MPILAAYVGDGLSEVDLMTQTYSKVGCDVIKNIIGEIKRLTTHFRLKSVSLEHNVNNIEEEI